MTDKRHTHTHTQTDKGDILTKVDLQYSSAKGQHFHHPTQEEREGELVRDLVRFVAAGEVGEKHESRRLRNTRQTATKQKLEPVRSIRGER